jgi:dihydroxyacetone kinase
VTALNAVAAALERSLRENAREVARLDAQAGDGDLGITAAAIADVLRKVPAHDDLPETLRAWAMGVSEDAPSTFGTLMATGLLRAANALQGQTSSPNNRFAVALDAAADAIMERGGAQAGQKTLLDALLPAAQAARSAGRQVSLASLAEQVSRDADAGAASTSDMRAVHGRAGWLADRSQGHEDAGARLVAIMLGAAAEALLQVASDREQQGRDGG